MFYLSNLQMFLLFSHNKYLKAVITQDNKDNMLSLLSADKSSYLLNFSCIINRWTFRTECEATLIMRIIDTVNTVLRRTNRARLGITNNTIRVPLTVWDF